MRIVLCNCENVLLEEIANPDMKRKDIALTYGLALVSGEEIDWPTVNGAIIGRWSRSGLLFIKKEAWKIYRGKDLP